MSASNGSRISSMASPPPPHNPERPRWYPTEVGLNFQGIDAPTRICQIPKVEKLNNLAINVFGWDKGVTVYRLSTQPDGMHGINFTTPGSRTSTVSSMTKASTRSASTSASAVCTASQGMICWKPTDPTVVG